MSSETVYLLQPEIILALAATLIYLGGAFFPRRSGWSWLTAAVIVLAAIALYRQGPPPESTAGGDIYNPVTIDRFSTTVCWIVLAVGLVFTMLSARTSEEGESSEYMGSLLLILSGLMLVAMAGDLILMFVALELISIPTYVLLFLGRGERILESGTKYFFLSLLASALTLYGFSFLYGAAGSTSLLDIRDVLLGDGGAREGVVAFASLALVFIFAGLGFRFTIVPFHFYAPDVYQGTTNPNAGLLAVVPKIAALVALVRLAAFAMPGLERLGWQLALALAMVTMTLGNVLALWQTNLRRLMAYSSIAHAGYMLIGLAVAFAVASGAPQAAHFDGIGASLFYLIVYSAATAGTFAALVYLGGKQNEVNSVSQLAGLSQIFPKTAALVAIFMFSLTGLPPLAGFWGKFTLFTGALGVDARDPSASSLWPWFLALAIVGAVNAAISAAYYLRIVATMYFRPPSLAPVARGGGGAALAMGLCAILVVGIGCYPGPLVAEANRAAESVRAPLSQPRIVPETASKGAASRPDAGDADRALTLGR